MSINELEMKCQELRELQRLIEEAQAEAETIKDAIKAHMGDSETAYAGEYKITWKPVTTVRIDTTALKKQSCEVSQHPEIHPCVRKAPCASPGKHQHKKP